MTTKIRNEHRAAWLDGRLHDVPEYVRPLLEASGIRLGSGMNKRTQPETEKAHVATDEEVEAWMDKVEDKVEDKE